MSPRSMYCSSRMTDDGSSRSPVFASREMYEEKIAVTFGRSNVAGGAFERPQIKRFAMLTLGKGRFVQTKHKNHFEWNRSQRGKRPNRDASPRILSAPRFEIGDASRDHLSRRLIRHLTDLQFRLADRLDRFEEAVPDLLIDRTGGPYVCIDEFDEHQRPSPGC